MCRHAGFRGGGAAGWRELTHSSGARGAGPGERLSGLCGLCCVFSLSVSLLFPLFAVLLNCPYPDPPVSACSFPFFSAPRWGEGRLRGTFVAGHSQTRRVCNITRNPWLNYLSVIHASLQSILPLQYTGSLCRSHRGNCAVGFVLRD